MTTTSYIGLEARGIKDFAEDEKAPYHRTPRRMLLMETLCIAVHKGAQNILLGL